VWRPEGDIRTEKRLEEYRPEQLGALRKKRPEQCWGLRIKGPE
jgi:hypothetical protein